MNICVFSSAYNLEEPYKAAARELGALIGKNGHALVWGGGRVGTMGVIADAAQENGAKLIGIIASHVKHQERDGVDEMIVVETLAERKKQLLERSDAVVVLPGGLGTLDEVTDVMEAKKHGAHTKEIVFLNVGGFYDGTKMQLDRMDVEGFLPKKLAEYVLFANTPTEVMSLIEPVT
ncbi:TIGR00730 family Rossman fold protein [Candidatus Parcubacteria bacterium]|nr:MAG: TIGR00730 family Rossman fold protein [Candidatus Parcubacteria bacterium]